MFHQVEGIYVDNNVSFAQLKELIFKIIHSLFGENIELRLPEISTPGSTLAVADNSSRNTNTTTIVQTSPNNRVSDTLNNAYG